MTLHLPDPNPGRHYARKPRPAQEKQEPQPTFTPTPVDDCGELIARGVWCRRPWPCELHGGAA